MGQGTVLTILLYFSHRPYSYFYTEPGTCVCPVLPRYYKNNTPVRGFDTIAKVHEKISRKNLEVLDV